MYYGCQCIDVQSNTACDNVRDAQAIYGDVDGLRHGEDPCNSVRLEHMYRHMRAEGYSAPDSTTVVLRAQSQECAEIESTNADATQT